MSQNLTRSWPGSEAISRRRGDPRAGSYKAHLRRCADGLARRTMNPELETCRRALCLLRRTVGTECRARSESRSARALECKGAMTFLVLAPKFAFRTRRTILHRHVQAASGLHCVRAERLAFRSTPAPHNPDKVACPVVSPLRRRPWPPMHTSWRNRPDHRSRRTSP
jgi:hypothetical protein